ncbi:hypothetical protein [Catenibacterium sp.]|uniref:hypothetical protein n=2 Tax=Catenibacterium sp. TaxID=2049022 RepID=UPI003FD8B73D
MENLCKLLEIILEKYFFDTIISVAVTLLVNIVLPSNYWMIEKIGITYFRVFVFCAVFVIFSVVVSAYKVLKNKKRKKEQNEIKQRKHLKQREENLEFWRNQADNLSCYERRVIVDFIKSGNAQRKCNDLIMRSHKLSEYILKTKDEHGCYIVKMNDNAFKAFSSIYKKYGKLGHFDD